MKNVDFLIVGQGLAGSTLAWTLDQCGYEVLIIDDANEQSSSRVAAGIFNPVTGKRLNATWLLEDIFPIAKTFYRHIETVFDTPILHECNVYRPFRSYEEQNSYLVRTAEPQVAKYILQSPDHSQYESTINNEFGGLEITNAGWIDVPVFLDCVEKYFDDAQKRIVQKFDYQKIEIKNDAIFCENIKAKKIVFCEGFGLVNNPYFNWLKFNPVKGEVLTANIENYSLKTIINRGMWVLPLNQDGLCRMGATYNWDELHSLPTESAKAEIEDKIRGFLKRPYTVVAHTAGVRPATDDRRPLIGQHPVHEQLLIFNGLGTKGVTLAPYFAYQLADYLILNKEINPLVNIERYFSLYFRQYLAQ